MSIIENVVKSVKDFVRDNKEGVTVLTAIGGIAAITGAFLKETGKPLKMSGTICSMGWECTTSIAKLQTVRKSGWSVPSGAKVIDTEWTFREMKKVPTGKDENGFTAYAEKPIYATKYYYEVKEWVIVRNVRNAAMFSPGEPIEGASKGNVNLNDGEKISRVSCQYYITLMDSETRGIHKFIVNDAIWMTLRPGILVSVGYSRFNTGTATIIERI